MAFGVYGDHGRSVINVAVTDDENDVENVITLLRVMEVKSALEIATILKGATHRNVAKTSGNLKSARIRKRRNYATRVT